MSHKLNPDKKDGARPINTELAQLKDRPRIAKLLEEVPNAKFGTLGFLSNILALEIKKELIVVGLYSKNPRNPAEKKFLIKALNETFDIFRTLKTKTGRKGKVVANLLGSHLGIKVVSDPQLMKLANRRQLVLKSLQLNDMQEGLDGSTEPENIHPEDFFDRQFDRRNRLKKVDTNSYYVLVRSLAKIQEKYNNDPLVINWCAIKLRQLEEFEKSLEANWLAFSGVRVNRRLSALKKDKASIYNRERTPKKS